ncbi:MAG: di-trans,poly-cis-decaprenylcistransferase [Methanobacteriota archaeon]|nr:MAG: di-trans,poly-cis-decaprenylcistransferase [Euryarchaeota archaeon]
MRAQSGVEPVYERYLLWQCKYVPIHVAIIQDGNRRFAKAFGVDTADGHRAGADTTERMLEWAQEIGIKHITLYSFSTENFGRDASEVEELFALFSQRFEAVLTDERVHRNGIRVRVFGERKRLPRPLIEKIEAAEEATKGYSNHFLNVALAYGGRNEIVHAARSLLTEVKAGRLSPEAIDTLMVERQLTDGGYLPPVDLIVRTGNEFRTSNFLPWLANGNECVVYFCAPYWPVFRKIDLLRAIRVYDQRMRLIRNGDGRTS